MPIVEREIYTANAINFLDQIEGPEEGREEHPDPTVVVTAFDRVMSRIPKASKGKQTTRLRGKNEIRVPYFIDSLGQFTLSYNPSVVRVIATSPIDDRKKYNTLAALWKTALKRKD